MTVHHIHVIASVGGDYSLDQLNTEMDDWVSKQSEWTPNADKHTIHDKINPGDTEPIYREGSYRFFLDDAKDNLIQKCEDKLENKVSWYRLGYESCLHDEETTSHCDWDEQREWTAKDVTIPDYVPVFVEE